VANEALLEEPLMLHKQTLLELAPDTPRPFRARGPHVPMADVTDDASACDPSVPCCDGEPDPPAPDPNPN
jgi:hypothetical protein